MTEFLLIYNPDKNNKDTTTETYNTLQHYTTIRNEKIIRGEWGKKCPDGKNCKIFKDAKKNYKFDKETL